MSKTSKSLLAVAAFAVGMTGFSIQALAASATGTAVQVVTAALNIANVSDLNFGTAVQGDAAKSVSPGADDNIENGSFVVTGQPNSTYTIALPGNGTVTMTTGAGGTDETIAVDDFASFPADSGQLDAAGSQVLLVGATRAALSPTQVAGDYTGTYTVTVVY